MVFFHASLSDRCGRRISLWPANVSAQRTISVHQLAPVLGFCLFLRFVVHSDTEPAESEAAHKNMNAIFGHAICRAAYCYWAWQYRYGLPMNGCSLCGNDEPVSWFDLDSLLENVQSRG